MASRSSNTGCRLSEREILKLPAALFLFICLIPPHAAFSRTAAPCLTLHQVFYVEGPENFQPSGLTLREGHLYTVCDKRDHDIYRLDRQGAVATAVPAVKIPLPFFSSLHRCDFEGITCDSTGNFFLASEARSRILNIPADGSPARWITPDLKPYAREAGLLMIHNAGLEGICLTPENTFLLCAERERRGIIEIHPATHPMDITAYSCEKSPFSFPPGVSKDFSGLCFYQNAIYVLERNAYSVSRLERDADHHLSVSAGWSFKNVETLSDFRYADMTYGKSEGLCMDEDYIYVILDNNGLSRAKAPDDRRPLLLVFEKPDNF